jgi:hypothetical protein
MARKSFPLRIDDQVFEALRLWADDEFRSVNGQIEYLLRDALRRAGRLRKGSPESAPDSDDTDAGADTFPPPLASGEE